MISKRLTILLSVAFALSLPVATASAYWTGFGETITGSGSAGTTIVNQGSTPTAALTGGSNVAIHWGPTTLSNGLPVDGYDIRRYDADSGVETSIGADCTGIVAAQTCTDEGVPDGIWQYSVTPRFADDWRGETSESSGAVNIGSGMIMLDKVLFGAPIPTSTTGSLAGFGASETVSYSLDDGTPIDGSPTTVGIDGTAEITDLEIPDVADGPHTIHVENAGGTREASAGILVDTTAPTASAFITPDANEAGWNRGPVELDASSDDSGGSGVAFLKGTGDGSDPRTSPTAQLWDGAPVPISVSSTVRYYAEDVAGNQSPVETIAVKIDQDIPKFQTALTDVQGGAFLVLSPTALPRLFYRGVDAGSFRFLVTVTDPQNPDPLVGPPSGPAAFGSSELGSSPLGFTHVSELITEPEGGPYLGNPVSWVAGTDTTPAGELTVWDVAGNTGNFLGVLENDSFPPVGGSIDVAGLGGAGGQYSDSATLNLTLDAGTDPDSGLAASGARLLRASATLTSSGDGSGGVCGTYGTFVQVGGDDPATTVSDTVPETNRCYSYHYSVADHVGNLSAYTTTDIKVVTGAPFSLTPSGVFIDPISGTGPQFVSGATIYYRPSASGSFTVSASSSDDSSGVAHVDFPAIAGFSGGGAVHTPTSGGTYGSTYAWNANGSSPSPGTQAISATDNAGYSSSNDSAFSVVADTAPPTGGTVDADGLGGTGGRYSTSTTLNLNLNSGTDAGSGVHAPGRQLLRASASLTSDGSANGTCGAFGPYSPVGATNPSSPYSNTVPADGTCYRYELSVPDNVGNVATFTSPDIKVDATAPSAPAITFSNLTNSSWTGSGTTVFYRPASASGSFTVNAASADPTSGTSSIGFPTLSSGWTSASGGPGVQTYSWQTTNPAVPPPVLLVTSDNHAGGRSNSGFTITATSDAAPPTGGSVSYVNGYSTNPAINVSFTKGTDSGSGLAAASGILQRSAATLADGACGAFDAFATVATNPTSAYSNPVDSGCYMYRYLISDNVGNQTTYTSASIAKVDQTSPTVTVSITNATGAHSAFNGAVLYYRGIAAGTFRYVITVNDDESGGGSVLYPAIATSRWTHAAETISTPSGGPFTSSTFSWTASPGHPASQQLVASDRAGRQRAAIVSYVEDSVPPSGGSISYPDGFVRTLSVALTTNVGFDNLSGVVTPGVVKRDVATLNTSSGVCGTFPGTFATTITPVGGADTSVIDNRCYRYRLITSDVVGNQATWTSTRTAKVDTTP